MTRLTEVYALPLQSDRKFGLREVFINPASVSMIRSEPTMQMYLAEGRLPEGMDERIEFSRITTSSNGSYSASVIVIGAPQAIDQKLNETKQLLKG